MTWKSLKDIHGKIMVSSCLLNFQTRYDGSAKPCINLIKRFHKGDVIFYCPEQGWWLPTPREPAEIEPGRTAHDVLKGNGRVLTKKGKDVTENYIRGAKEMLRICQEGNIECVILKSKSPSCGVWSVFDGFFWGNRIAGNGITAELLIQNGITVYSEEEIEDEG